MSSLSHGVTKFACTFWHNHKVFDLNVDACVMVTRLGIPSHVFLHILDLQFPLISTPPSLFIFPDIAGSSFFHPGATWCSLWPSWSLTSHIFFQRSVFSPWCEEESYQRCYAFPPIPKISANKLFFFFFKFLFFYPLPRSLVYISRPTFFRPRCLPSATWTASLTASSVSSTLPPLTRALPLRTSSHPT